MRRKTKKPEDIKDVVGKVIGRIEKQGPGKKERIVAGWKKAAGEKAAGHSRPVNIRRNVLTIEVDSSTWFYALNLKRASILKDIRKELSEYKVEDVRFRMGEDA